MNVVDALNRYRLAVARNPTAFSILSYLYLVDVAEERELFTNFELQPFETKNHIRQLYQARLVETIGSTAIKITPAAAHILAALSADEHLVPELLSLVQKEGHSSAYDDLYRFAVKNDQSLKVEIRNRLVSIAHLPASTKSPVIDLLVLFSMVPPDSVSRAALSNIPDHSVDGDATLVSQGTAQARLYRKVIRTIDESDALLRSAAQSAHPKRKFSDAGKSHAVWRFLSYINTDQSDRVLEGSFVANPQVARTLFTIVFEGYNERSFFADTCESAAGAWNVPFSREAPHHTGIKLSDLLRDAIAAKTAYGLDDLFDVLPTEQDRDTPDKSQLGLNDFVSSLRETIELFSSSDLAGGPEKEAEAVSLLHELRRLLSKRAGGK